MRELPHAYDFGPFRLDIRQRILLQNLLLVRVPPKAIETLILLVKNCGRVIEKDEFLKSIWCDTFVEEATLAQNIFILRRILDNGCDGMGQCIQTIPKRGYRFIASVLDVREENASVSDPKGTLFISNDSREELGQTDVSSLAVLPLIVSGQDPNAQSFGDGLTNQIVNALALLPEVHVKACSTVDSLNIRKMGPQEAGRELGVEALLVGRIMAFDERVIVRIELVEVPYGWQLWGAQYSEKVSDISKVQEKIAKNVSRKIQLKLQLLSHPSQPSRLLKN